MIHITNRNFLTIVVLVMISCFLFLGARATYTSYESSVDTRVSSDVSGLRLKVNGVDVVGRNLLADSIVLENITWNSTHTRDGKISPGSEGTIDLELDPSNSEVAILYEFEFSDHSMNEDYLLNFGEIDVDGLVQTGEHQYSGIFTIDDIHNSRKKIIHIPFYFDSSVDMEGITMDLKKYDDLFGIDLHVLQYRGEELVPYTEP